MIAARRHRRPWSSSSSDAVTVFLHPGAHGGLSSPPSSSASSTTAALSYGCLPCDDVVCRPRDLVRSSRGLTRTVAPRERNRLEGMRSTVGIHRRPYAMARQGWRRRATSSRHEARHSWRISTRRTPARDEAPPGTGLEVGDLARAPRRVLPRCRREEQSSTGSPARPWVNGLYRWVPCRPGSVSLWYISIRTPHRRASAMAAACLRPRHEIRISGGGRAGRNGRRAALAAVPHDRGRARGRTGPRAPPTSSPRTSRALGGAAPRRSIRRRWAGRTRLVPRRARLRSSSTQRQRRADRVVGRARRRLGPRRGWRDRLQAARGRRRDAVAAVEAEWLACRFVGDVRVSPGFPSRPSNGRSPTGPPALGRTTASRTDVERTVRPPLGSRVANGKPCVEQRLRPERRTRAAGMIPSWQAARAGRASSASRNRVREVRRT